ncbi:CDIF630_02480 family spore surface protein [Clostridium cellulovorans]|uniref:DUF3787 domain-containing protein n=1 Tax=Clostridium cellulovorans (strain ATCC 35296 / DSM 3052 / OCM 3 / 743B) TaxID=573061 RepID=D9SS88_CLOC7|nr:DUF3787 domain-containing protein [Clostridium cellulovorans]ADL52535.1 hypothetical protein Clocel_2839 [Clostridium cellulovorans 743B]
MSQNRSNEKITTVPIERHDTAAWANMEKQQGITNVNIPSDFEVDNAKDHVDTNEK